MADQATQEQAAAGAEKPGEEQKPDKVFTQEQLEKLIEDRLKRERRSMEARLLVDETFRSKALEAWEVKPAKGGKGEDLNDEKVQELYKAWEEKNVAPLRTERDGLRTEVENARLDGLEADLLASAGSAGIAKGLLKKQGNKHSALFNMVAQDFEWDAEHRAWRVKGKDGFRPSPDGSKLYMEPAEFLKDVWAVDLDNAAFITDKTQSGANFKGNVGPGGKRMYTRSEYAGLVGNESYYATNRDELLSAEREGRVR